MLEAYQSLRDELSNKKQAEVVQTSASASRPGTSAVNLDLPPPRPTPNTQTEDMDVDFGAALSPGLGSDHQNVSDQNSNESEQTSKKVSDRSKRHTHTHWKHDVSPRSASDQYSVESNQPRMSSSRSKKHADKSKYKSRSRYVPSSSEEEQPSVPKHRSSHPSGANSDQDQPQHDPDPPYYREVALADILSQYAEEVDTFRHVLSLPDPRRSLPRSSTSVMGLDDEKGRQDLRPRGPSSILPLSSKMPLINLSMTSRLLIYLKINISNLLLPLQSGTRWDSPVMGRKFRS